jgi:hypothetical protein
MDDDRTNYTNVVQFSVAPYDAEVKFFFRRADQQTETDIAKLRTVARVTMSLSHMKSMIPIMARLVAQYEEQFGQVPAPGFEQFGKE